MNQALGDGEPVSEYSASQHVRLGRSEMLRVIAVACAVFVVAGVFATAGGARGEHAPPSCVSAIAQARTLGGYMQTSLRDVQPLFGMVSQAAKAGAASDTAEIYALAAKLNRINSELNGLTGKVAITISRFNADAAGCH